MSLLAKPRGPIARTSLADSVYQHLLEAIVAGELASGVELSEVAIAAQLEVSRTPVHEALRRLAATGLVEQLANRLARVARFDRNDVQEIYEMREVLESAAAARAAERLDDDAIADLRQQADELTSAPRNARWRRRALEFDLHFHDVLASAAGNERLAQEIRRYRLLVRAFCRLTGNEQVLEQALREHINILAALEARDAALASQCMAEHVAARRAHVLATLYPR